MKEILQIVLAILMVVLAILVMVSSHREKDRVLAEVLRVKAFVWIVIAYLIVAR